MSALQYTPIDKISEIRDTLKQTFRSGKARSLAWRRHQLHQVARMAKENEEAFMAAMKSDLGKPRMESWLGEIAGLVKRILLTAESLEEWTKPEYPEVPDWQKPWRPTVYKTPKGVVLIIAPWNYPMVLSMQPFIGAIAAGCTAVIKPSELVPAFSALLAELIPKYLDPEAYAVVNGGIAETTKLLELQWDHIFYTGNGRVGRIIATAAAKHLTPVTLELGGKSPVIIDADCDINIAAKRILHGKCTNAGQICVCPDYVLIPEHKQDEFIAALKEHHAAFFPEGPLNSSSYGRIVNSMHHGRLMSILNRTKGTIVLGGKTDGKLGLEPTIIKDVREGDSLLEDELFGPLLPIMPVKDVDEAINYVRSKDHPLVLYAFTQNQQLKERLVAETLSGSLILNDACTQLAVNEIPFGGIGESGYGYQILKYTYDGFTHLRSSIDVPYDNEDPFRYPPYSEEARKLIESSMNLDIPPPPVNGH
ncbi:aldehyde dehydrogenase [Neolentinus lepideus HHB14362 ss-1]|uniref:Aldehyde dehydrogenase n=1 Tax=Neolentinus lepideus HHB14362 ss-1 TaxID=1314782 RepID=A0A165Q0L3_9AGAM|nr:aldehyde dehydrogenase [Neolentinus lepideus HHB14362 ss-1]